MAKESLLRILMTIISSPWIMIARIALFFNVSNIRADLATCLAVTSVNKTRRLSDELIVVLILAEDRRNAIHHGIDPIAMIRALLHFLFHHRLEGASTIEQQFVRVILGRYQISLSRKLREQVVSILLTERTTKRSIANSYLSIAFYGTRFQGIDGLQKLGLNNAEVLSYEDAIPIISRLKYPQPRVPSIRWREKHLKRNRVIFESLARSLKRDIEDGIRQERPYSLKEPMPVGEQP